VSIVAGWYVFSLHPQLQLERIVTVSLISHANVNVRSGWLQFCHKVINVVRKARGPPETIFPSLALGICFSGMVLYRTLPFFNYVPAAKTALQRDTKFIQ